MAKNQIQKASNPIAIIRSYLDKDSVKKRLEEILGKRAGAFGNSIMNVVRNSSQLQTCNPDTIMSSAFIAATMNLPIDPALGQAAIVPYKKSAQFQIMYRGIIQLCIRSGQYATIHCSEVYKDELKNYNPITGEVSFNDPATFKMRNKGDEKNVVGHYAHFELTSGFKKSDFMTHEEALAHAKQYSRAYQYDLKEKKKVCPWSLYPVQMGNKTILLRLLKKYGVMSIEMQEAFVADYNSFEQTQEASEDIIDSQAGSEPVDVSFEEQEEQRIQEFENEIQQEPQQEEKVLYVCVNNHEFEEPHQGAKNVALCPKCLTKDFKVKEIK
jgi:recombination protein RecT